MLFTLAIEALRQELMKPRLLLFYPHNPFSPKHGSHLRCLQQLDDLKSQYNIIFASSFQSSDSEWPRTTRKLRELERFHGIDYIKIFEASPFGYISLLLSSASRLFFKLFVPQFFTTAQDLIRKFFHLAWFSFLSIRYRPQAIVVHYTYWSYLSFCIGGGVRVIELHDLLPVNHYLKAKVVTSLDHLFSYGANSGCSSIRYIEHLAQLPQAVVGEIRNICLSLNRYHLVWMISEREDRLLRETGLQTLSDVIYPATMTTLDYSPKDLPPILPLGPNPFNSYSLSRFIDEVIPYLDPQLASSSEIHVTGMFWENRQLDLPLPMKYYGLVNDYPERLSRSSFMIAPTSVGTGQQIKIFESLGAATPVIAYRSAVPADVLKEYPSIIAVDTPREFAAMINNLLIDSSLLERYCDLAKDGARRQAIYRSQLPYCH